MQAHDGGKELLWLVSPDLHFVGLMFSTAFKVKSRGGCVA